MPPGYDDPKDATCTPWLRHDDRARAAVGVLVDIPPTLAADLRSLVGVLDVPDLELEQAVASLRQDVRNAIPSFVGLRLTLVVQGHAVVLTSLEEETDEPTTSLAIPLRESSGSLAAAELVLFAATPGAFVDLAADADYSHFARGGDLRQDQDLVVPLRSGLTGVAELTMVNRAIGLLIGRGMTPDQAQNHLEGRSAQAGIAVFQVAAYLLSLTE